MSQKKIISDYNVSDNWKCPVCGRSKAELLHPTRHGRFHSGITEHHYGTPIGTTMATHLEYLNGKSCILCEKCNSFESQFRKKNHLIIPLSPEEIKEAITTKKKKELFLHDFI